jgi:hypothetical protein
MSTLGVPFLPGRKAYQIRHRIYEKEYWLEKTMFVVFLIAGKFCYQQPFADYALLGGTMLGRAEPLTNDRQQKS